jgi:hypothetical protein
MYIVYIPSLWYDLQIFIDACPSKVYVHTGQWNRPRTEILRDGVFAKKVTFTLKSHHFDP